MKKVIQENRNKVFIGVFALQENPTGALRDGIDRAENGNLVEQEDIIELFNTILHRGGI